MTHRELAVQRSAFLDMKAKKSQDTAQEEVLQGRILEMQKTIDRQNNEITQLQKQPPVPHDAPDPSQDQVLNNRISEMQETIQHPNNEITQLRSQPPPMQSSHDTTGIDVLKHQLQASTSNLERLEEDHDTLKSQHSTLQETVTALEIEKQSLSQTAHDAWKQHLTRNVQLQTSYGSQRTYSIKTITEEWNLFHQLRLETTEKMDALIETWETLEPDDILERPPYPPTSPIGTPETTMEKCFSAPEKEVIVVRKKCCKKVKCCF